MFDDFDLSLPDDFPGRVRLLPLPTLVMLPGVVQGFHLDQPAQKKLVIDSTAADGLLAFGLVQGPWAPGAFAHPKVHSTICVGKVLTHGHNEDQSINLLACGARRATIVGDVPGDHGYRIVEVDLLEDVDDLSQEDRHRWRVDLLEEFQSLANHPNMLEHELIRRLLVDDVPLGILVDLLASAAEFPPEMLQNVLETVSLSQRCELVRAGLVETRSRNDENPGFLPPFSEN